MNGGDGNSPVPSHAYTEIFKKVFPHYLAIGMTYDQFWNQDVELVKAYREADEIRRYRKNQDMWLQGAYIYEALLDASPALRTSFSKHPPKPVPYRQQPYELYTSKEKLDESSSRKQLTQQEKSDKKAKAMMEMFMVSINKKFEKKGGEGNG